MSLISTTADGIAVAKTVKNKKLRKTICKRRKSSTKLDESDEESGDESGDSPVSSGLLSTSTPIATSVSALISPSYTERSVVFSSIFSRTPTPKISIVASGTFPMASNLFSSTGE